MSDTASEADVRQWSRTEAAIELRRQRVLAGLATMGRTAEQQQFRRHLRALTEAALRTGNYGPLDRYLQSWYEHTIRLATDPAWARQWDELRRNPPPRPDPSAALPLEEAVARLGEPG